MQSAATTFLNSLELIVRPCFGMNFPQSFNHVSEHSFVEMLSAAERVLLGMRRSQIWRVLSSILV